VSANFRSIPGVPLIRFSHSLAFIGYLRKFGAPAEKYLGMSRLPTLCQESDYLVTIPRFYAFLEAATHGEDPLLGWMVGDHVGGLQFSSPMQRRLESAPSLLAALQSLVQLINSESSDIDVGIIQRRDDIVLYTHYLDVGARELPGYRVAQAYQISVFMGIVRMFLGEEWRPVELGLESQCTLKDLPEWSQGARFTPGSRFGYFTVPKSCLHHALNRGSAVSASRSLVLRIDELDDLELVRDLIKPYLPEGYITQEFAAQLMDISVRSLTRRLAEYGTTYRQLVDSLRFQVAKDHLGNPDMRLLEVANAVGFSDQGDFTRMFRRISGVTPGEFRRTL
jgi:AraC-like DNA-binding protein